MEPNENIEEEIDHLAPGFPKRRGYASPSGYFEQLPDRLIHQWQNLEATGQTKFSTLPRLISTAAIVAGICIGVAWLTHRDNVASESSMISSSDAYQYIIENLDEFEPLILQQEDWLRNEINPPSDSKVIEEYLIEELEGDDIETIF